MIESLLVANRGEIACRVLRTAKHLGVRTIAIYSEADRGAMHVEMADEAHCIGPAPARESYLLGDAIVALAKERGAAAIHPGYGFLSENAEFAEACAGAGIGFVGPPAAAISSMGRKDEAKARMRAAGVPVVPGFEGAQDDAAFLSAADEIGFPVLVKAVAGGGGKGMRRVEEPSQLEQALAAARREAGAAFGDERLLLEKWIETPRHIEVQVFADAHGNCVHLFERDCSLQRRHQKVLEEAPAPGMTAELRAAMCEAAVRASRAIDYVGAGTVEFVVDASGPLGQAPHYFIEMNTRLQVEHPVTEEIAGIDLVEWQLRVASGEALPQDQEAIDARGPQGHAVEVRLYSEDPSKGYLPSPGDLGILDFGAFEAGSGLRLETGVREGDAVTPYYDPMIAKLIATGTTRDEALGRMHAKLLELRVAGVATNARLLANVTAHEAFLAGELDTAFLETHAAAVVPPKAKGGRTPLDVMAIAVFAVAGWPSDEAPAPLPTRIAFEERKKRRLFALDARGDGSLGVREVDADGESDVVVVRAGFEARETGGNGSPSRWCLRGEVDGGAFDAIVGLDDEDVWVALEGRGARLRRAVADAGSDAAGRTEGGRGA